MAKRVRDGTEVNFDYDPLDPNDTPELPASRWTGLIVTCAALLFSGMLLILLMDPHFDRADAPGRV